MGRIYGGYLVAKALKEMEGISTVFSLSGGHIDYETDDAQDIVWIKTIEWRGSTYKFC